MAGVATSLRRASGPNMTAMVDVVMCILIFFMLASHFLLPTIVLKNAMPVRTGLSDHVAVKTPAVKTWIRLERRDGVTWMKGFDWDAMRLEAGPELRELFRQKGETLSDEMEVIVAPGAEVPYQDVITVYDCCVAARLKRVAFAPADF